MNERFSCNFLLRGHGDLTIEWDEKNHEDAVKLIQAKMDTGVSFFIIDTASKAKNKPVVALTAANEIETRQVFIRDADIKAFVEGGFGKIAKFTGVNPVKVTTRKAKTAQEAAQSNTVAVQPAQGG